MASTHPYESPGLTEIGSLHELTLLTINKSGSNADAITGLDLDGPGPNPPIGPGSTVVVTP